MRHLNILRVLHHNKNSCFFLNLNFRNNCFHLSAFPFEKYSVFIFRNLSLKTQNIIFTFFLSNWNEYNGLTVIIYIVTTYTVVQFEEVMGKKWKRVNN